MDETVDDSTDLSDVRSESLGEKRPVEDGVESDVAKKKARGDGEVRLAVSLKKVAEMVLVLATMGKMRAGRKPTSVEVKMMAEAREKLAEVCKEFAPKDIFPRDAFGTIIEDLGLNRLRETKLGILPPKMSIAQKLQLTKKKMEKSEVFPLHSATYTPTVTEPRVISHGVRTFSSSKTDHTPISSGSFQNHPTMAHASLVSSTRTLPYQLPTSEVRPGGSSVLTSNNLGRHSTASPVERGGRLHLRSDERSNANSVGNQRFIQSQSAHLSNKNHHTLHHMKPVQSPAVDNHNEISKIIQKILHPHMPDHHTWTPPSRDYMNKGLTCQTCKVIINEVDTTLICDACEKGYHLKCLQFNLKSIFGDEWHEWHCAKCLAISNGKPLPPKYGRVMRNISTPKMSINGTHECGTEKSTSEKSQSNLVEKGCENKLVNVSELRNPVNSEDEEGVKASYNGLKLECHPKDEIRENLEGVLRGNMVKTSESCTTDGENEGSSSSSMRNVDWVGDVLNEVDGKTYYRSCCISGTTYQLQDYALFSLSGNNYMPNKIQGMWEDNKTNKKWVTVTRCFFPDDLPKGVGRPCAPESNEVYESNHETTLPAGLIHAPCEILPPRKFFEEKETQNRSQTASDKSKPLFLCKWFYDEKKSLFRDVTSSMVNAH